MGKAMIISLGTGKGVEHGIARSIRSSNPDFIVFIATEKSIKTLPKIEEVLSRKLEKYEIINLEDEDVIEECYRKARDAIQLAMEKGYSRDQISVDFTSGTKAMSAGVDLAAISMECESLVYVAGRRDQTTGRVITGTERVITLTPLEIIADGKKKLAIEMFNRNQFDACSEIVKHVKERVHDKDILEDFLTLEKLASAYSAWDKFNHKEAMDHFKQIEDVTLEEWGIKARITGNKEFLYKMIKCERYCLEHIVDLLQNAKRRASEGKYDDAIARLYRTIELIVQHQQFSKHKIDTSDVDIARLPEKLQEKYEKMRKDGEIKLGLRESYELLHEIGDELGRVFKDDKELLKILNARNQSILAHGLNPLNKNSFEKFYEAAHNFASAIIQDIEKLEEKARFPILGER